MQHTTRETVNLLWARGDSVLTKRSVCSLFGSRGIAPEPDIEVRRSFLGCLVLPLTYARSLALHACLPIHLGHIWHLPSSKIADRYSQWPVPYAPLSNKNCFFAQDISWPSSYIYVLLTACQLPRHKRRHSDMS